jgi:hypothetical protein
LLVVLEHISGHIANVASLTNLTMNTGDSLNVRSFDNSKQAWLLNTWAFVTAAGFSEVHSPRMHDNVHSLRFRVAASQPQPLLPLQTMQRVYPVDTLTVQLAGDATAGRLQPQSLLLYYQDVPGLASRLMAPKDVWQRAVNMFSVETTITLAVTGDYSTGVAINANNDQFIANTDYAIVGYVVDTSVQSVHWRGADIGNVRVGGPGPNNLVHLTSGWFLRISDETGLPLVPVINSQNKGGVIMDALMSQAGGTLNVSTVMVQLSKQ